LKIGKFGSKFFRLYSVYTNESGGLK